MQTSRTTSDVSATQIPLDVWILSGLPIGAVALLILIFFVPFDWVPLTPEGDSSILSIVIGICIFIYIFSIPVTFFCVCLTAAFSGKALEKIRKRKQLNALWGIATLIILPFLFVSGHGNPNSRGMRTARTNVELSQICTGIAAYETEYGEAPATSSNRELIKILNGNNARNIEFIIFRKWELNTKGDAIDGWGTPIRISLRDPKNPLVQSAGADRVWSTSDDLIGEKFP